MRVARTILLTVSTASIAVSLTGCHLFHHRPVQSTVKAKVLAPFARPPMAALDLTKVQPNEAGMVPILEYHDLVLTNKTKGYQYPAAAFRRDIQWLYDHNYRPISLHDYVLGVIDCPAGMSPVILTFDDALKGQFRYSPDGKIDPNCAVGILDDFHAKHPDWPLKGSFFVLTNGDPHLPPPFYQADTAQGKMEYLVREGFEIGNHTVHHQLGMRHWPDARVQQELAQAVTNIHAFLPTYLVDTLALPYGVFPKNKKLVIGGSSGGVTYHNICALKAGAEPAQSPMSIRFKPYYIPRIIPGAGRDTIRFWLDYLEKNKGSKFVSDGDPNTYTLNVIQKSQLSLPRLQKGHFHLRTYNGTQVIDSK